MYTPSSPRRECPYFANLPVQKIVLYSLFIDVYTAGCLFAMQPDMGKCVCANNDRRVAQFAFWKEGSSWVRDRRQPPRLAAF